MENASKALIMAGGVLISLMIVGALVLMFSNLSNYQKSGIQNTREAQVLEFNNQYLTYNRKDVKGSDLYSLFNKVIDYNRRKTTNTAKSTDEGKNIKYTPMKITVYIEGSGATGNRKDFAFDGTVRLITNKTYEQSNNVNTFENEINKNIESLERDLRWKVNCTEIGYRSRRNL